jgi:hypothetical protein
MIPTTELPLLPIDERGLADWLLSGAISGDYTPVTFDPEPSIPTQLHRLFASLSSDGQQTFKRAITTAINEWSIASHSLSALRTLALVAAYVRATAAITPLAHITRSRLVTTLRKNTRGPEEIFSTIGILLAVISGFAPTPEANTAAEALYYDERLPHRFAPILLTALCRAYPEEYASYLPRALRIMQHEKEHFHIALILDRVVDVITPKLFAKHFSELENDAKPILTSFLNEAPNSRVRIEASQGSYSIITTFSGTPTLWECPIRSEHDSLTADDMAAVYNPLRASYAGEATMREMLKFSRLAVPKEAGQ